MSKVKENSGIKAILRFLLVLFLIFLVVAAFQTGFYLAKRNHGNVYITECVTFSETSDEIYNPNRGFYYIYGFRISDDVNVNYEEVVSEKMFRSRGQSLAMIQINLQEYAEGPISEKGLKDIEFLFQALRAQKKQYLIRFLYDWNGENLQFEPQDVNVIIGHIQQLKGILHEYKDIVFINQGLFIGNWGEMNGTIHLENMQLLANELRNSLHEDTFMAVRMPAQWRKITETASPIKDDWVERSLAHRLGLFNDGIMGNYGDYGTYGIQSRAEVGDFTHWNREEELAFQEELCKYVPNGGEVIVDNEYNDFDNAVEYLRTMHITYLNCDYDKNVLEKWAKEIVSDGSVYDGMDGLTYIDRHLGYRILLNDVGMEYDYKKDVLSLFINLQNVGFAPIYKPVYMKLSIKNEDNGEVHSFEVDGDLSKLSGGNDAEYIMGICHEVFLSGYKPGIYTLYFSVVDVDSAIPIVFANEQEPEEYGYKLGQICIEEINVPLID